MTKSRQIKHKIILNYIDLDDKLIKEFDLKASKPK